LEFEREVRSKDGRVTRVSAELWDTSGDKKYEDCWPAITHKASGVILAYDPTARTQEKDIELWHKAFVAPLRLSDAQQLLCAHQRDPVGKRSWQPPRALEKLPFVASGLDNEDGAADLRRAFDSFLVGVVRAVADESKADTDAMMQSLA